MALSSGGFTRRGMIAWTYFLMMAAWLFDFSSGGAGQGLAIQGVFLVEYSLLFLLLIFLFKGRMNKIHGLNLTLLVVLNFAIVGCFSGLAYGQSLYAIMRHFSTLLIFAAAIYSTAKASMLLEPRATRRLIAALCALYAISSIFVFLFIKGSLDISTVRYQIIGASTIAAFGAGLMAFAFKLKRLEVAAFLIAAIIVIASVTRTYLVVVVFQAIFLIIVLQKKIRIKRVVFSLAIAAVFAYVISGGESVSRWQERLFVSKRFGGVDPTYLTRTSEWEYMWSQFTASLNNFLFGSGLGAQTKFYLASEYGGHGFQESIGYGHNQHISLLFIGGVVGGLPLLILMAYQVFISLRLAYIKQKNSICHHDLLFLLVWSAMILCGFFVYDCFASVFGDRRFTLWLGIGTGILLGIRERFNAVECSASG